MAMSLTSAGLLGTRKCSQRIGVHALSGCDTVLYPFGKGNKWTLKLMGKEMPGLNQVLTDFCGQKSCTIMNDAHAHVLHCRKKTPTN